MTKDSGPEPVESAGEPADEIDGEEWAVPDCPRCGRPVWVVTVTGPITATASPCGCSVAPGTLERE
ncbi:hypothetical protein [Natrinema versiforme]|uniref:Small CPxCG-related zinc finger protein n=1 Tax=Natrinema versiforme TaxID=88724 RepID=A0A4V1FXH3_9EURY|nr:hypothetical protein [Natrinema versiforme]QCS40974.1 hypothetical protein FEJ81_00910 [Natrinema versiforme]